MSSRLAPSKPALAKPDCPVIEAAVKTVEAQRDFADAFRQLRRAQIQCKSCPVAGFCEPILELNRQIDQAIREVTEEWNLSVD